MHLTLFLDKCSWMNANVPFSEHLPWVAWCYSDHPLLCSAMGTLRSESGVRSITAITFLLGSLQVSVYYCS